MEFLVYKKERIKGKNNYDRKREIRKRRKERSKEKKYKNREIKTVYYTIFIFFYLAYNNTYIQ